MALDLGWIEVAVDGEAGARSRHFRGRWLLPPDDDNWSRLPGERMSTCYGLAAGERGELWVYSYHVSEGSPRSLARHRSIPAALSAGVPADVVARAVGADRERAGRASAPAVPMVDALPVLLVSDDALRTRGFREELEADGYAVSVVAEPELALATVRRGKVEVVFLDVSDGLADPHRTRRLIEAARRAGSPPVILIASGSENRTGARRWRFQLPPAESGSEPSAGRRGGPPGRRSAPAA